MSWEFFCFANGNMTQSVMWQFRPSVRPSDHWPTVRPTVRSICFYIVWIDSLGKVNVGLSERFWISRLSSVMFNQKMFAHNFHIQISTSRQNSRTRGLKNEYKLYKKQKMYNKKKHEWYKHIVKTNITIFPSDRPSDLLSLFISLNI